MTHAELSAAGFTVSSEAFGRLSAFVRALRAENQKLNLTSLRSAADIWPVHVCDSLALLAPLHRHAVRRLLDLGTGGGLPGVPLAIARPDLEVTVLDATGKKVRAVERIVAEVGLTNVRCVWGRAEALAHESALRGTFDGVTARAVAALPTLVELTAGFVAMGGYCWFFKTPSALAEEQPAAQHAATLCGLAFRDTWTYTLPGGHGERVVVAYQKDAPTPPRFPRPAGRIARYPL